VSPSRFILGSGVAIGVVEKTVEISENSKQMARMLFIGGIIWRRWKYILRW
jgi:hypothetical protein